MKLKIQHPESESSLCPLSCKYDGQSREQDAYITLDCDEGILSARYDPEIGGAVTQDVWHGRTIRWPVSSMVTWDEITEAFDLIKPYAESILESYRSEWIDGNFVPQFDESTDDFAAIRKICDARCMSSIELVEADDWFEPIRTLIDLPDDGNVDQMVTEEEAFAAEQGVLLVGAQQYLEDLVAERNPNKE